MSNEGYCLGCVKPVSKCTCGGPSGGQYLPVRRAMGAHLYCSLCGNQGHSAAECDKISTDPVKDTVFPTGTDSPLEMVDHPDHYGGKDNPYEAIKVIEAWKLGFCLGNTIKYISRSGKKLNLLEDLKKAKWYLDREIQRLENNYADS